jgi:predicted RNA-binding Zn ribbon-like protein
VIDAALVVALANAQAARRPPHAPAPFVHDALADTASANELLGSFLDRSIQPRELKAVRALQGKVIAVVDALIDGSPPPLPALNALAAQQDTIYALEFRPDGTLRRTVRPRRASASASLLITVMDELSELEPSRLKRCARRGCDLVFYDGTRSGTQRWHAERPCGLRERQRRYRHRQRLR